VPLNENFPSGFQITPTTKSFHALREVNADLFL